MPCNILKALSIGPTTGPPCKYNLLIDFVATLDLMSVPLFDSSILGIVSSMEPSRLIIKTGLLEEYLHLLKASEIINVFKFLSAISLAREDAEEFLTDGLIDKICQQMVLAESHNQPDVTGAAITLMSNIASLRFQCVMTSLKCHLDKPCSSILQTIGAITSKNDQESVPHLLDILSKVKSMNEVNLDSRTKMVLYNLMKNFMVITQKHLNYQETEEKKFAAGISSDYVRLLRIENLSMKIVVGLKMVTYHSPICKDEMETRPVDDLIMCGQWSTEAFNSFSFGFNKCDTDKELSFDIKEQLKAMSLYVQNILIENERRNDLISYLLPVLRSSIREAKVTSTLLFSKLLHHPGILEEKRVKELIHIMIEKTGSSDLVECRVAVEAIGNATRGSPKQIIAVRNSICEALLRKCSVHQEPMVTTEILKTLCKIVRLVRQRKLGENFDKITVLCTRLLNRINPVIQMHAASLFADLAKICGKPVCGSFNIHVEDSLSTLFIKLHSEESLVAAAGVVGLFHLLPYVGCKDMKILLGGNSTEEAKRANLLSLYKALGRMQPRLLKMMVLQSMTFLRINKEKKAVLEHLKMLIETIPHENLSPLNLKTLFMKLLEMLGHQDCLVVEAANSAVELLGAKWKSLATIQSCFRSSAKRKPRRKTYQRPRRMQCRRPSDLHAIPSQRTPPPPPT